MSDPGSRAVHGWRLSVYFALLVAVFAVVAAVATVFVVVQSERDGRRTAERDARFAAQKGAEQLGRAVSTVRSAAGQLAATPGVEAALVESEGCALSFDNGAIERGHIDILRADGSVACSSRGEPGDKLAGYQGAPWLARAVKSELLLAPVRDEPEGGHALIATAPIKGGTVAAFLSLEPLGPALVDLLGLGRPFVFLVASRESGTIIARSAEPSRWVGRSLEGTDFERGADRVEHEGLDGVTRVYGSAPVPGVGWTFHAGVDKQAALAQSERLRDRELLIILVGLGFSLAAAFLAYRRVALPMKRLGGAVRSSSSQTPRAPVTVTGPAEVAALAEDVNGLIESVNTELAERHRAEAELRQAQRLEAIGRLAGGVAHDFNNLLTAMLGNTDLLLAKTPVGDPRRREAEELKRTAERAAALTRQLMTLGRGQDVQPTVIEINEAVAELEPLLRRLTRADITIETRLAGDAGRVRVDRGQIEQVLVNLVVNASDAMPDGGHLLIATATTELGEEQFRTHAAEDAEPGRYCLLEVTDTGAGMDEETLSHVFEPFFTTKEEGSGTGLGLATVYGIVRQSGGFIWADSEPGRGASFKVYLPAVAAGVREQPPAGQDTSLSGEGVTVLLVEDDPSVRAVVRRMLDARGFDVAEASQGDEALTLSEAADPGAIDLLITDTVMPGPGGVELAQRVRERHPALRTMIMSGYSEGAATGDESLGTGAGFIAKPFVASDLYAKLSEVLVDRR